MIDGYKTGFVTDPQGNRLLPITHINLVVDNDGRPISSIINQLDKRVFNVSTYEQMLSLNINNLMKEAKKMQAEMQKSQEELATKEFDATAGGGAISVKVTGEKVVKEIKIKPDVVDPDDVEMLEDLILTCVNEALRKVDSAQSQELGKFNIPGLM